MRTPANPQTSFFASGNPSAETDEDVYAYFEFVGEDNAVFRPLLSLSLRSKKQVRQGAPQWVGDGVYGIRRDYPRGATQYNEAY